MSSFLIVVPLGDLVGGQIDRLRFEVIRLRSTDDLSGADQRAAVGDVVIAPALVIVVLNFAPCFEAIWW